MPDAPAAGLSDEDYEALIAKVQAETGHAPAGDPTAPPADPAPPAPAPAMSDADLEQLFGGAAPGQGSGGTVGPVASSGGFLDSPWQHIKAWVSGDEAVEHPDLGPLNAAGLGISPASLAGVRLTAGLIGTRDPQAIMDIIKANAPDATFSKDRFGNPIVQRGDGPAMYVQRPGLTPDKALYYAANAIPAVATGGSVGALPFLARTGAAGLMAGGQSVAGDLLAMAAGSKQGIDPEKAKASAAGGAVTAGAIGAVAPLVQRVGRAIGNAWQSLSSGGGDLIDASRIAGLPPDTPLGPGMLTETGRQVINAARNTSPEFDRALSGLTIGHVQDMQTTLGGAPATPANLNIAANVARTGEFDIQPTLGQAGGDPKQLRIEDALSNAPPRYGQQAGRDLQTNYQAQRTDVGAAKDDIIGGDPSEEAQGQNVIRGIRDHVDGLNTAEDAAWQRLGDISPTNAVGRSVNYNVNTSSDLWGRLAASTRNNIGQIDPADPSARILFPGTIRARGLIRDLVSTEQPDGSRTINGFNLGDYNATRRALAATWEASGNPADQRAVSDLRTQLDDAITTAHASGNATGDPTAIGNLQAARAATRAKYAFIDPQNNPAAATYIQTITNRQAPVSGQTAVDNVIGQGPVPGNVSSIPIMAHLQDPQAGLPANNPAHDALGDAATSRILYGRGEPAIGNARTISQISNAVDGPGAAATDALIDPARQARMTRLQGALSVLQRSEGLPGPRMNKSQSGYTIGNLTTLRALGSLPVGPIRDPAQGAQAWLNARRALDVSRTLNQTTTPPPAAGLLAPVELGRAFGERQR